MLDGAREQQRSDGGRTNRLSELQVQSLVSINDPAETFGNALMELVDLVGLLGREVELV